MKKLTWQRMRQQGKRHCGMRRTYKMKSLIISTMTEKMVVVSLPVRAQGVVIVPWVGSVHGGVEGIVS